VSPDIASGAIISQRYMAVAGNLKRLQGTWRRRRYLRIAACAPVTKFRLRMVGILIFGSATGDLGLAGGLPA